MGLSRRRSVAMALLCAAAVSIPVPDRGNSAALPIPASAVIDGHPATWRTCSTVGYTLNVVAAPPGAIEDTQEVLADLAEHTGLRFAFRGLSTRMPQSGDLARGAVRADAPLTIAWSTRPDTTSPSGAGSSDLLSASGETAGRTITTDEYRPRRGLIPPRHLLVAADVVLDASLTRDIDGTTWGGRSGQRAFLQHELAHAVGLDHSDHPGSVLAPKLASGHYRSYPQFDQQALSALTRSQDCHKS